MNKVYCATAGLVLGIGLTAAATAGVVSEREPNDPVGAAVFLDGVDGEVSVEAALGVIGGTPISDLDYFSFYAEAGDVVTVDIDNGYRAGAQSVDTLLGVFGPGPEHLLLRMNDDAPNLDTGSVSRYDARIDNFLVPATGTYTIGVSHYPRHFQHGGGVAASSVVRNGDYVLVVTGLRPVIQQIGIEVKPGSDEWAPVNPKSRGKIPVAILSSETFDAMTVEPDSLTFGPTGGERSLSHCGKSGEAVNDDAIPDLVCHFSNQEAGFRAGDLEAILKGRTRDGQAFEGRGLIKVVPQKSPL